jgi:hypothetical protein
LSQDKKARNARRQLAHKTVAALVGDNGELGTCRDRPPRPIIFPPVDQRNCDSGRYIIGCSTVRLYAIRRILFCRLKQLLANET